MTSWVLASTSEILHVLAFGWPLGFPLPSRELRPLSGAILLVAGGLLTVAMGAALYTRRL